VSLEFSPNENVDLICGSSPDVRRKRSCPNASGCAVAFTFSGETAGRLRSALGGENSDARQSRVERDALFAKNAGWINAENAGDLYTHALHLRFVSRARR